MSIKKQPERPIRLIQRHRAGKLILGGADKDPSARDAMMGVAEDHVQTCVAVQEILRKWCAENQLYGEMMRER